MKPFLETPFARGFLLSVAALTLAGCKPRDQVTGSPEPPASFGPLATSSGCPTLTGAYAWPAVEGAPQGYAEGGIPEPRKVPDFFGAHSQWKGEFQIQDPDERNHHHVNISSRPHGLISKRYSDKQHSCKAGWRVLAEYMHPSLEATKQYGEPISLGVKLTTLANGDLAIGQALRIEGHNYNPLPIIGIPSVNWMPGTDRVTWYWSRYRRVSP